MFVFIVGAPRSGTTLLANFLNRHPSVAVRYEPYYVWEKYFSLSADDVLKKQDATEKTVRFIQKSFDKFQSKTTKDIIIDKSPRNSLRIPFINAVFPNAKWIHIIRDGRDATLSIYKRWLHIEGIAGENKNIRGILDYFIDRLAYERFISDKLRFLWHEGRFQLKYGKPLSSLRWDGNPGWGPRFQNFRQILQTHSTLEFCAYQWLACINSVQNDLHNNQINNFITVYYENLIGETGRALDKIFNFLNLTYQPEYISDIPLRSHNMNKWQDEFTNNDLMKVYSIIGKKLTELGYEDIAWRPHAGPSRS